MTLAKNNVAASLKKRVISKKIKEDESLASFAPEHVNTVITGVYKKDSATEDLQATPPALSSIQESIKISIDNFCID